MSMLRKLSHITPLTTALLVAATLAGWWLWGGDAHHHATAIANVIRTRILGVEPAEFKAGAIDAQIDEANKMAQKLASSIGQVHAETKQADATIDQLKTAHSTDLKLLEHFRTYLDRCSPGETVIINGKRFTRAELEHEARELLDIAQSTADEIDEELADRNRLAEYCERMRADLRDWVSRIRKLERGQNRVRRLIRSAQFREWVATADGQRLDIRVIAHAEEDQAKLAAELNRANTAAAVMARVVRHGPSPAADAIQIELNPRDSLEVQIDELLKTTNSFAEKD